MSVLAPIYPNESERIFHNLKGIWNFSRKIHDQSLRLTHKAEGEAIFEKELGVENMLYYRESGVLKLSNQRKSFVFQRKYIFQMKNGQIQIIFDDGISKGKLYQTLIPDGTDRQFIGTEHPCVMDIYQGKYYFPNDKEFTTLYTITGPQKDLLIETIFKKQGGNK